MTYSLPFLCLFLGSIVGCLLYGRGERVRIAQLELDKEMLLDFNEKLIREKEELGFRYEREARSYIRHLDSHICVFQPADEEWPELIL